MSGTCDGLGWCVKRDAAPLGEPWCNGAGRCVKGYAVPVTGPAVPSDEELRSTLAEALRQHRWLVEELAPLNAEDGYLPGAPCMDCGSYPGPLHDRSDECPRVLAKVLLPVVRRYADQRAAEVINGFAAGTEGLDPWIARKMRDRADALTHEATT